MTPWTRGYEAGTEDTAEGSVAGALAALLREVRDACLYSEDGGEIGITEEPTIDSDLFDRICAALKEAGARS